MKKIILNICIILSILSCDKIEPDSENNFSDKDCIINCMEAGNNGYSCACKCDPFCEMPASYEWVCDFYEEDEKFLCE